MLTLSSKGIGFGLATQMLPKNLFAFKDSITSNLGEKKRFNVLFIAVDDLRPQLGCYGHEKMISPNIDQLAKSGLVFQRAYCQQAICAPSRASLLSGCRPSTTHVHDLTTPLRTVNPEVVTLPQHFKNHGHYVVSLGKIFHHRDKDDPGAWSEPPGGPRWSEKPGGPRGFWPGYVSQEVEELRRRLWKKSGKEKPYDEIFGPPVESADVFDDAYPDGQLAVLAIEILRRIKNKQFFLAVGFYKPHLAFACPKKYWNLYQREEIDLADNPFRPKKAPDIALHNWGELRAYHGIPQTGQLSDAQARELVHGYYACVSFVDAQIGRVLAELERLGLRDKTIIVLWGDHGWHLGEHSLWCKHTNFETAAHSPLIMSVPELNNAGQKTEALVEFVDIYPSLCELCGLPLLEQLEGISFVPLLKSPDRSWKKAVFSECVQGETIGYSVRTDRYRYTEWGKDGKQGVEIYDHQNDPQENVNIASFPEMERVVATLSKMLREGWRAALPEINDHTHDDQSMKNIPTVPTGSGFGSLFRRRRGIG